VPSVRFDAQFAAFSPAMQHIRSSSAASWRGARSLAWRRKPGTVVAYQQGTPPPDCVDQQHRTFLASRAGSSSPSGSVGGQSVCSTQPALPAAAGGRPRAAAWGSIPSPAAVTRQIKAAASTGELQLLWQQHGPAMNHVHISALLVRLAHLQPHVSSSNSSWLTQLVAASRGVLVACAPRNLSNMLWAWARLKHDPGPGWLADWSDSMTRQLASATARDVSSALWALAALEQEPGRLSPALLAELLAALGRTLCLSEPDPASARSSSSGGGSSGGGGGSTTAQDVSNSLWALARLGTSVPPELLDALLRAAQRHQEALSSQARVIVFRLCCHGSH